MGRFRLSRFAVRLAVVVAAVASLCLAVGAAGALGATAAPTLLAPSASSAHNSPLSVEYELPEAGSSGTIQFVPSSGPTVVVTLSSPALAAGKHHFFLNLQALASESANVKEASAASLADGEYTVILGYSNLAKEVSATASAANVTIKTLTGAPALSEPKAKQSFRGEPVKVKYTLPEAALGGSVKLTLAGVHSETRTLTLSSSAAGSHTAEIVPSNPAAGAGVASVTPSGRVPADTYTIVLSYQDTLGNPAASAVVAEVGISYPLCKAGSYGAGGEEPCTKAPRGYFDGSEGAEAAIPCALGRFAPEEGMSACTRAEPGHYVAEAGAKTQLECEQGSYAEEAEAVTCKQASAGHYAPKGSAFQIQCAAGRNNPHASAPSSVYCELDPPGTFSGEGAASPTPCEPGRYAPSSGATSCSLADPGSYAEGPGASGEKPCPAGTFSNVSGSASCTETPAGTYATGGAVEPTPCPAGTSSGPGASACAAEHTPSEAKSGGSSGGSAGGAAPTPQPTPAVTAGALTVKIAAGKRGASLHRGGRQRVALTCSAAATIVVRVTATIGAQKKHLGVAGKALTVACAAGKAAEATIAFKLSAAAKRLLAKRGASVKLAVRVSLAGAAGGSVLGSATLRGRA